ncbi:heat domain containing protein [Thermanaeromonas toyohensis ToBE]|uniref:Heat domain containing protein n=1 Tax=Thermanaeromonas toyohensis ToBE TaxID=698762 RepID=A0A1W1W113_9FIRM|nr:HEAT repeat domain-containing protein [Thermanaeromonas toyohensis]SMB99288.1 heat domain containing protein [Thermanaeromonas toyohensis ToBE]
MVYKYCPACYALNKGEEEICQYCGQNLKARKEEDYLDKLIWALNHRDKETVARVVNILKMLGPQAYRALPALEKAFQNYEKDPYLQADIILALGEIGGYELRDFLFSLKDHPSIIVQKAVCQVLAQLGRGP